MKKFTLLLVTLMMLNLGSFAQNSVKLNINHKLGNSSFALSTGAKNNLGDDFEVTRLEYYISEISVIHDGGTETAITNVWALVNATTPTQIELGDHNITSVESVKFHVGVDAAHNHLDPASYASDHPLAPKSPSMHWGWASGYRFVVIEGNGGSSYNQLFQLHGLDDNNYLQTQVTIAAAAANGEVNINLNADYTKALENIAVNAGVIVHGAGGDAQKMLQNFNNHVFTPTPTSTIDLTEINAFDVFPNPSALGKTVNLSLSASQDLTYQVNITDLLGRQVEALNDVKSNSITPITFEQSGMYFVQLIKNGQVAITKKLLIY